MNIVRRAVVAGQFYPATKPQLEKQIEQSFTDSRGVGKKPLLSSNKTTLKGLIVPHAGYVYSGAIAAHAYSRLADTGFADTFIILGPNHTGVGSGVSVMTTGAWSTPLGSVPIDTETAQELISGIIDHDDTAHSHEHSIEVQLPFLQYLAQSRPFHFIPICMMMQDSDTAQEVGTSLAQAIQKSTRTVVVIASSDFSHVGFNYRSMPPQGIRVDKYATTQDKRAIDRILALDPKGLIQTVEDHNITMCGYGPVAALLIAAKQLGATKAELLKYGTSYEVHPDASCVGYGALVVH